MLKPQDLNYVRRLGLYSARDNDFRSMRFAGEYLAMTEGSERNTIRFYIEEGVRNYCLTQYRFEEIMREIEFQATQVV